MKNIFLDRGYPTKWVNDAFDIAFKKNTYRVVKEEDKTDKKTFVYFYYYIFVNNLSDKKHFLKTLAFAVLGP